jgi:hypothetical protein
MILRSMGHDTVYSLTEKLVNQRVLEEQRLAELRRLAREARSAPTSWLVRPRCWPLCQLGRFLMSLGRRLLEAGHAPAQPFEEPGLGVPTLR